MFDRAEFRENPLEIGVREHEGITTTEENISYLWGVADILKTSLNLIPVRNTVYIADFSLSRTVSAVHCTCITYEEQDSIGIPVCDSSYRTICIFMERIFHIIVCYVEFTDIRTRLLENGIVLDTIGIDE